MAPGTTTTCGDPRSSSVTPRAVSVSTVAAAGARPERGTTRFIQYSHCDPKTLVTLTLPNQLIAPVSQTSHSEPYRQTRRYEVATQHSHARQNLHTWQNDVHAARVHRNQFVSRDQWMLS